MVLQPICCTESTIPLFHRSFELSTQVFHQFVVSTGGIFEQNIPICEPKTDSEPGTIQWQPGSPKRERAVNLGFMARRWGNIRWKKCKWNLMHICSSLLGKLIQRKPLKLLRLEQGAHLLTKNPNCSKTFREAVGSVSLLWDHGQGAYLNWDQQAATSHAVSISFPCFVMRLVIVSFWWEAACHEFRILLDSIVLQNCILHSLTEAKTSLSMSHPTVKKSHQLGRVLSQICDRFSIATDGHLGTRHLPVKFM